MVMKRALVVVVIVLLLIVPAVLIASQNTVIADYSGERVFSNGPVLINGTLNATAIPSSEDTLYIVVIASDPLYSLLTGMLEEVARENGLNPTVVPTPSGTEDLMKLQFKGRVLVVYVPFRGEEPGLLSKTYLASIVVYYSTSGDILSFITTYNSAHTEDTEEFAEKLSENANRYLTENLLEGTVGISWWKNLKVHKGYLAKGDPYREMVLKVRMGVENLLRGS
ncbi:hypothetical protein [Thermococcus sp. 4557]|uniref:hypothetical protein n=1 Tax=Thermococcus sp. (strain CGMCC 1.5172 / 4557) TaxID=1042877 RepID=UPI0011D28D3B|nr:hypothetical protein [Thermococcus sp. 4557]